jgi:PAS domain S-box-containing protein
VHKLLAVLLLIVTTTGSAWADAAQMAIGVLVSDGEHNALERWSPTASYLTRKIPGQLFVIVLLDRDGVSRAVERNELDFILTNPGQYVELATAHGITSLATILHRWSGKSYPMFGAAIITRADRQDIKWLPQIKGKSFMAVSRNAFDSFQLTWWEFKAHDIDPFHDFSRLIFSGLPPEEIVHAVRNGSVDAATVRAGVLERMASEGKIDLKEFRILHPHVMPEYPFARSTELYPEWPFAKARSSPEELVHRVANALQTMPADHPAARAGGYAGWTAPLDYRPAQELLEDSRLFLYANADNITFADIFHKYRGWLIAGIAFLLLSAGFVGYMSRLNYRLRLSKHIQEIQFAECEWAEQMLRRSERALRALHDITSKHNLSFEKKVQALLALGCEQFGMPVGILSRIEGENYEIVEVVPADGPIPKGCIFPLGQTYCSITLQSSEPMGFEHAAASEWRTHPAYLQHRLEAYLGIRVEVYAGVYGTLNFISPEPRTLLFTNSDKEVLKLMAQWVGAEIGRQHIGSQMRKLSGALEQTADAVMISNRAGLIEYVNPAFEKITGYTEADILGKGPKTLQSGRHGEEFYRRLWGTILRGEVFHDTFINRRKDGLLYYEEKTITPLKDEHGFVTHFISTGKDVTKRKLAEEHARQRRSQLAHVQRVSAMGAMATSLAHELNQPLAAIVNYAQGCIHRLRGDKARPAEFLTALEHIAAEGKRSGEIIRRVREYLRKGKPLLTRVDINQIVREAADLANPEARQKDIALYLELSEGLPPVLADAVQIEQVVLNLVHNAIEAIDGAQSPRREVTVQTHSDPKNGVEVTVRDTGPGIPVKNSERLFAPFFTTRPDGMGMGLSISRSIVEAHGDRLEVMSNPDGGAVFRFALSAVQGEILP